MSVEINKIIGKGYKQFWFSEHRYLVVKGGRGSKKSTTTALKLIYNTMRFWFKFKLKPNTLVIRKYYNTHKQSTRSQLVWAINSLGVSHMWNIPKAESTLTFIPSGQQIIFRGLDDSQSLTSIMVSDGYLCWVWWEEAFQVNSEQDFNKVDLSIRGDLPSPLFKQHILTLNPWSNKHWIKQRFFDTPSDKVLALTTNYTCNEFLGKDDIEMYEELKNFPRRYQIEGLGEWGISEGLIFSNWEVLDFDVNSKIEDMRYKVLCGLDFGYTDPSAFIACLYKRGVFELYIFDEMYQSTMSNQLIADTIRSKGFSKSKIYADSEDPRTINELKLVYGITGIVPVKKETVLGSLQKLQDYKIIIHPRCTNTIVAFSNYVWSTDKTTGNATNVPEHDYSHIPDALRYATRDLNKFGIQFA